MPADESDTNKINGWIGVDLDGTLAYYDHWRGEEHIGEPIPKMASRVRGWLAKDVEVRIFTARATKREDGKDNLAIAAIKAWTLRHFGQELEVTNVKDYGLIALYDDRAVGVEENTGELLHKPQRKY